MWKRRPIVILIFCDNTEFVNSCIIAKYMDYCMRWSRFTNVNFGFLFQNSDHRKYWFANMGPMHIAKYFMAFAMSNLVTFFLHANGIEYIYRYKYLHINFRVTCMHALECMGVNHALLPTFTREYDDSKPMRFVKAWHCCRDPDRGLIVREDWMHRACMSWPSCDLLLKGVHWTLLCWCKLANVYVIYITLGRNFQLRVGDRVNSWDLVFKFETADIYIYITILF